MAQPTVSCRSTTSQMVYISQFRLISPVSSRNIDMALPPKKPLLVVEDDGLIRMDFVDTLQEAGYPVVEAANADEAWAIMLATEVAALVTDIDMPGSMDGLELAR